MQMEHFNLFLGQEVLGPTATLLLFLSLAVRALPVSPTLQEAVRAGEEGPLSVCSHLALWPVFPLSPSSSSPPAIP